MRLPRLSRPSPAIIVALLAFVVAGTGGYAIAAQQSASVIRACSAKRGGALRLARHCNRRRERAISWNSRGPGGARGLQGPTGPSNVFEADRDGSTTSAANGTTVTVATLSGLPAGSYDISAKTDVTRLSGAGGVGGCTLTAEGDADGANEVLQSPPPTLGSTIPTHVTHTFGSTGTATLTCTADGGAGNWVASHTKVMAIKVGSLTRNAVNG